MNNWQSGAYFLFGRTFFSSFTPQIESFFFVSAFAEPHPDDDDFSCLETENLAFVIFIKFASEKPKPGFKFPRGQKGLIYAEKCIFDWIIGADGRGPLKIHYRVMQARPATLCTQLFAASALSLVFSIRRNALLMCVGDWRLFCLTSNLACLARTRPQNLIAQCC